MLKIKSLKAREILDSRGNPTVKVSLETEKGIVESAVPSGASTGKHEAVELRDGGKRYNGLGVLKAVKNINGKIASALVGKNVLEQEKIDRILISLDGTENKSNLGANAILGVSIAVCKAGSLAFKKPLYTYINHLSGKKDLDLPRPCFNIINGGAHAGNDLNFQEFMIMPRKKKISESVREASEFYHSLKDVLRKRYSSTSINVGDEGGFAPPISNPEDAINLIVGVGKIDLILDVAAGEFFNEGKYKMGVKSFQKEEMVNYYLGLIKKYPILGLEDPFAEDDWEAWRLMMLETKSLIVGDDLIATNPSRIKEADRLKACNSMILKPNQIGTVSESIESAQLAKNLKWKIMVSHRSGETNDDFISDFAVGIAADFIKAGAPARGERVAKYNRLMEIEEELS